MGHLTGWGRSVGRPQVGPPSEQTFCLLVCGNVGAMWVCVLSHEHPHSEQAAKELGGVERGSSAKGEVARCQLADRQTRPVRCRWREGARTAGYRRPGGLQEQN